MTVLRDYQQRIVEELASLDAAGHTRATVTLPCGTGKTVIAAHASAKAGSLLVIVPTLALLDQTVAAYEPFRANRLVVASHGTTDPDEIAQWLSSHPNPTVFTTYASFGIVAQASIGMDWDQVVCDEAHRSAGVSDKTWAQVLDDDVLRAKKRTFYTATPKQVCTLDPVAVASMDDPALYGPVLAGLTLREAIDSGWLSDYQVAVVTVPASDVPGIRRGNYVDVGGELVELGALAGHLAIQRWAATHPEFNTGMVFCNRVETSREWASGFDAVARAGLVDSAGPAGCLHIDGDMSPQARAAALDWLRETPQHELRLVSNCRVLSEGVDVPALDAVVFAQPRTSAPDIVQIVGRCLRVHPQGRTATIVIPVLIDDAEATLDEAVEASGSGFVTLWQVLTTLAHEDPALYKTLATLRAEAERGEEHDERPHPMVIFDTPDGLPPNWAREVKLQALRRTTSGWSVFAAQMARYAAAGNGVHPRPGLRTDDGYPLGRRAKDARTLHASNRLPATIAHHIEDTVPGWTWQMRASTTVNPATKDELCRHYLAATGSTDIPTWAKVTDPHTGQKVAIGSWFATHKDRIQAKTQA